MSEVPPFSGFPQQGLDFLAGLAEHNEREWFQARKDVYQDHVLAPALDLCFALGERLRAISPGIITDLAANGSGSVLRIYRDVRFSKDKRPYNTHVRLVFWEGGRKKMENPSFFVRIDPRGVDLYAGLYAFPKPFLAAYREAVDDEALGPELEEALAAVRAVDGATVGGDQYKRVPRGYDADHPRADLLRFKGIYAQAKLGPEVIPTPELVEACTARLRDMAPLHHWLVQVGQRLGT